MAIKYLVSRDPDGSYLAKGDGISIFVEAPTMHELLPAIIDGVNCHLPEPMRPDKLVIEMDLRG